VINDVSGDFSHGSPPKREYILVFKECQALQDTSMNSDVYKIEQSIAKKIQEARKAQGLSYEKLAEKAGLHRTSVSLIERGKSHPTLIVCLKLSSALGISLSDLLKSEDA